jgi:hypothetical protein
VPIDPTVVVFRATDQREEVRIMEQEYTTPEVTDYGTVEEITAGDSDGESTDKAFPVNTPKRFLTFS